MFQSATMYDQFLRHTTNRLQDDLRSEMKHYTFEKERLSQQLSHLGHSDLTSTDISISSSTEILSPVASPRKSQYFRAPNMVATTPSSGRMSVKSEQTPNMFRTPEKKWREKKDQLDKIKKEKELLKLPVIHSASSRRSEWESGKFLSSKQTTISGLEPLPGISAAKELLVESMKIPSIYDPQRTDTAFDSSKGKKVPKKVTFADENDMSLLSVNQIEANNNGKPIKGSKNSNGKGHVPKLNLTANQFSHVAKPKRPRKTSLLPPLKFSPSEVHENPQRVTEGINQWKSLYSTIIDPEEKTRALTDIMNAVRLRKFENEQAIKYGDGPRPSNEEILKEFMSMNAVDQISYRDEFGNVSRFRIYLMFDTNLINFIKNRF